jgi:hypothetical protein
LILYNFNMTRLDKIVKEMIEHANNAGTEVKEKEI